MTINATEILSAVAPWELSIQVGTRRHVTRPPTLGEMFAAADGQVDLGRLRTIVSSWLGGASVDELSGDELGVIVAAVAAYAAARSKKNQAAIAAAIAGQIE